MTPVVPAVNSAKKKKNSFDSPDYFKNILIDYFAVTSSRDMNHKPSPMISSLHNLSVSEHYVSIIYQSHLSQALVIGEGWV